MTKKAPATRWRGRRPPRGAHLTLVEQPQPEADAVGASFEGDKKARAKTLLQTLLNQADLYPEFAAHLEPAVTAMRAETKRTTRSTRDWILRLLEPVHSMTFDELREDMLIPEEELWGFLRDLVDHGYIEMYQTGRRTDPNKGRTEYLFKISHSSPTGCSYSSPSAGGSPTRATMDSLSD